MTPLARFVFPNSNERSSSSSSTHAVNAFLIFDQETLKTKKKSPFSQHMAVPGGRNGMMNDDFGGGEDDFLAEVEDAGGERGGPDYAWADIDREVPPHLRPLADAAQKGDVDALRAALDNYTGNIDDPVEDGDTMLHLACLYGHLPCVQLLLERGASLECKDEEGAIALHDACAGGFAEIVRYILNFASGNADCITRMLDTVDLEGDTPLHHAARGEHLEIAKLLLEVGASPTKENAYGQAPAELADAGTEVHSFLLAKQGES